MYKSGRILDFTLFLTLFSITFIQPSLLAQKDWVLERKENGVTMYIKDSPDSEIKQFKIVTVVRKDFNSAYTILKDIQKMPDWYDGIKSVTLAEKISDNEGIYILEYALPFPLQNRVATVHGKMEKKPIEGKIYINTKYKRAQIPSKFSDLPVITKIWSSWEVTNLTNGKLQIVHQGSMDPGESIPRWMVNAGVKKGPFKTMKAFLNLLQ